VPARDLMTPFAALRSTTSALGAARLLARRHRSGPAVAADPGPASTSLVGVRALRTTPTAYVGALWAYVIAASAGRIVEAGADGHRRSLETVTPAGRVTRVVAA
jgi:hypothetical protein